VFDLPFCPPFVSGDLRRVVFCSLSLLEREFKKIPSTCLKNSILCLDADRSWVFHQFSEGKGSERQIAFLKSQFDSRYFDFEPDFLAFLREKEDQGVCYWHRPNRNYKDMSKFFESIKDPVEEKEVFYNPLMLDEEVRSYSFSSYLPVYTHTHTHTLIYIIDMGRLWNIAYMEKNIWWETKKRQEKTRIAR